MSMHGAMIFHAKWGSRLRGFEDSDQNLVQLVNSVPTPLRPLRLKVGVDGATADLRGNNAVCSQSFFAKRA